MTTSQEPAALDLEAEYNNRARVPEHPAIFESWRDDALTYRERNAPTSLPYGPSDRQIVDLFTPARPDAGATVMFVHGGYWQSLDRTLFSHMAKGLNAHGVSVAVPGYDLCPDVSIPQIVDQLRAACRETARLGRPLVVAGHSAGGHIAACLLATNWKSVDAALPDGLVRAAYAISGLFDLEALVPTSINGKLGLDMESARAASPALWPPPAGVPLSLDAVVGGAESSEYHRQSRLIVEKWGALGVKTRYEEVPGKHHFDIIAPLADPNSAMTARLLELARP
jgi:arylformamidase